MLVFVLQFDETTQDLSVSQLSQSHGADYMEEVAWPSHHPTLLAFPSCTSLYCPYLSLYSFNEKINGFVLRGCFMRNYFTLMFQFVFRVVGYLNMFRPAGGVEQRHEAPSQRRRSHGEPGLCRCLFLIVSSGKWLVLIWVHDLSSWAKTAIKVWSLWWWFMGTLEKSP